MSSVASLAVRLLAQISEQGEAGLIVVLDGDHRAESVARLLHQLAPRCASRWLPAWDCLPYDRAAPSPDIMGHRMRVLQDLAVEHNPGVLITTPEALIQRVPARSTLPDPLNLKRGLSLDVGEFGIVCSRLGYSHADRVDDPGHVAIRGEVIDIFPATRRPCRLTLAGGKITTLHLYDPMSQRTTTELETFRVEPVSEVVLPADDPSPRFPGIEHWLPDFLFETETVLDLLPGAAVTLEPDAATRLDQVCAQVLEAHRDRVATDKLETDQPRKAVDPRRLFVSATDLHERLDRRVVAFPEFEGVAQVPRFCLEDKPHRSFSAFVAQRQAAGRRIVLSAARDRELVSLQREVRRVADAPPNRVTQWDELASLDQNAIGLIKLSADHGFDDGISGVTLITAADLLGHQARAETTNAVPVPWHLGDGEFAVGDFVTHLDHGMGILQGIETVADGAAAGHTAVRLSYANDTQLLTPVAEMDRIWRYGAAVDHVIMDRLDTDAWQKRRIKLARELASTAKDLVKLATRRKQVEAAAIVPPRRDYERFVAAFRFAPTADQMHAIDDCLRDLASGRPMDRLVVGDVGFGKTEVAMRAAAAAVLAGWQVAVVAPTTVLVRQHAESFERRFGNLGIEVAHLSRVVSAVESERIKSGLAGGSIRLVVGTQALMAADVAFEKLGLLIVDEEQRFGTADKAQLRTRAADVHVLTMSATPIPRTLQSALVGLQDLSVIATPPARRRPIRTVLAPFDSATVRAALLREKARGGQSFVVVPRIEDLEPLAARLAELMPGFDIRMGHGRMNALHVDETMLAFANGAGDVLLATSIIESGLDVPRANTMVVCDADRFGLAQLHQLRGRVGRGRLQGVCFLTTAHGRPIAAATERRLATITKLDRLGSGIAISAHDLDARGAGDLTGDDQAGHMQLVGLGLYQHLLQQAIREASGELIADWIPELNIGSTGEIPEDYIPEDEVRINLYARLARAITPDELHDLSEEVEDRFGPLPESVATLFAHARLKSLCRSRQVAQITGGPKAIAFTPRAGIDEVALLAQIDPAQREHISIKNGRLILELSAVHDAAQRVQASTMVLQAMSPPA